MRPKVRLVCFDTEPMHAQLEERLRWGNEVWLMHAMGHRTYDYDGPYFVERTQTPEEIYEGGPWMFWFNTWAAVKAQLGGQDTFERQLIVCPKLRTADRAGGQGMMWSTVIIAGDQVDKIQTAAHEGSRTDESGWKWALGVLKHEIGHSFGLSHPPPDDGIGRYLLMQRGFYLPESEFLPRERKHLRSILE